MLINYRKFSVAAKNLRSFPVKYLSIALVSALFVLASCQQVQVNSDGGIPAEAASQIENFVGNYKGDLRLYSSRDFSEKLSATFAIELLLDGNKPVAVANRDILGNGCDSHIGKLVSLQTGGAWDVIAGFEFDPGHCPELAESQYGGPRQVVFYAARNGKRAMMSLYKKTVRIGSRQIEDRQEYRAELSK